jgi:3-hydroxyisobutyrate dehydrogenase-like beta-hydroxyacid dehydrogenase
MGTETPGENVRVAVLGTGIMGSAMVRNLADRRRGHLGDLR